MAPVTTCLYCPTIGCAENAVDVKLRYAAGRWWSSGDQCPTCGGGLIDEPTSDKLSTHSLSGVEREGVKYAGEVADAQPHGGAL